MTSKLTITRERLQEIAEDGFLKHGESKELARMALAAMDSEPVAYTDEAELCFVNDMACMWTNGMGINEVTLYRHAQPVVPNEITSASAPEVFEIAAEAERLGLRGTYASYAVGWNACRASMLQTEPVMTTNKLGNPPAIPDSARDALEKALAAMEFMGDTLNNLDAVCTEDVELVAPAFDAVRNVLAAAPKSPGSEPATVPGKWIPVSERMPESNKFVLVSNGVWVGQGLYDDSEHLESDEHWQDEHREFINVLHHPVTHWMPLPAAPKEEKP